MIIQTELSRVNLDINNYILTIEKIIQNKNECKYEFVLKENTSNSESIFLKRIPLVQSIISNFITL